MDINIIAGKNSEFNNEYIFSLLRNRDKSKRHIIIAPDRSLFSLEQRLFDETQESCFFDVSITSISKLSKELLVKLNNKNILTKQSGVALVKKLLHENYDQLAVFKKSSSFMGFASNLFETICLYKSCNISCDEVYVDDSISNANLKQKDIKLIYTKYENFLKKDYTDSFNQLILFTKNIDKDFCKDAIFYFVEFDDFTSIMYGIISKIARFSDACYISATYGRENNNSNIYSNKVYYDLISLFRKDGLQYKINKIDNIQNQLDNVFANNLLAYNPDKYSQNDKITINSFDSIKDEIKYTIASVYKKVIDDKSLTFSDFAIILPNFNEYLTLIRREIQKYNISYFIDKNELLIDQILIRNLLDISRIILGEFDVNDFVNILKSKLLNFNKSSVYDYDNNLRRIGSKGFACIDSKLTIDEDLVSFIDLIYDIRKGVKICESWQDYLEKVIYRIYDYILSRSGEYISKLDSLESRIFNQVIDKFESINKDFGSVFAEENSDIKDFLETYKAYFETTNISLPPITSNTLFIADFNSSYITKYKHIYILGCNEGVLPKLKLDNGLVTDEEIARLPNASQINPTISMLNTRKVFKLFEIVFKAKDSLVLSCLTANAKGKMYPNNLILSFIKILGINVHNGSNDLDIINNSFYALNKQNIVFNNLTYEIAIDNIMMLEKYRKTYQNNPNFVTLLRTITNVMDQNKLSYLLDNSTIGLVWKNLNKMNVFRNNSTSVSQIESYYNCPYLHFVRYGLRLRERNDYRFEANDIGTIIHTVLKDLVPIILDNSESIDDIITRANEILARVLADEEYREMSENPVNAYIIKSLYNELKRVCVAVTNELSSSNFKPYKRFLEYSIRPGSLVINDIDIKGSIDRVDINGEDFIILDYKTGNNSFNNYNEVFSGKKLQLLVYAKAFANESKKNIKGVYYFPLSNGFVKEDASYPYRLNGVTFKDRDTILAIDNNLSIPSTKSKVINITTTKDGEFSKNNYYNYMCLEKSDFDYLIDFAIKQVERAIISIQNGNITPRPIRAGQNKSCDYCQYKGLCNYQDNNDNIQLSISNIAELKEKGEKR